MLSRAHFIAHYHFKIIIQSLVLKFNSIFNWGIFTTNTEKKVNSHIWHILSRQKKIVKPFWHKYKSQRNEYIWKAQIQVWVQTTTLCLPRHYRLHGSLVNINVRTFPRCQLTHLRKGPYSLSLCLVKLFLSKSFFFCVFASILATHMGIFMYFFKIRPSFFSGYF